MLLTEGSKWKTKEEKITISINKYENYKTNPPTVVKCKERKQVIVSCLSEGNNKRTERSEAKDDLSKRKKE